MSTLLSIAALSLLTACNDPKGNNKCSDCYTSSTIEPMVDGPVEWADLFSQMIGNDTVSTPSWDTLSLADHVRVYESSKHQRKPWETDSAYVARWDETIKDASEDMFDGE